MTSKRTRILDELKNKKLQNAKVIYKSEFDRRDRMVLEWIISAISHSLLPVIYNLPHKQRRQAPQQKKQNIQYIQ